MPEITDKRLTEIEERCKKAKREYSAGDPAALANNLDAEAVVDLCAALRDEQRRARAFGIEKES